MPKPGYSSQSLPDWMMDAIDELKSPGNDNVDVIREMLFKNLGKPRCAELYELWKLKHYPNGGQKPFG